MAGNLRQLAADLRRRQHHVDRPRGNGGARHAVELRRRRRLREGDAAGGLDVANTDGAVRRGTGEYNGNRLIARRRRQRREKAVDRRVRGPIAGPRRQVQGAAVQHHLCIRWDYVDVVALQAHAFGRLDDRHSSMGRQQRDQGAVVMRRQVLHQDQRDAGVGVERLQQLREGFESARRSTNADDGQPQRRRCELSYRARIGRRRHAPPYRGRRRSPAAALSRRTGFLLCHRDLSWPVATGPSSGPRASWRGRAIEAAPPRRPVQEVPDRGD